MLVAVEIFILAVAAGILVILACGIFVMMAGAALELLLTPEDDPVVATSRDETL